MGGARSVPGARQLARLVRLGGRRHPDGPHRRALRHPLDRDVRLGDDRVGLFISTVGQPWQFYLGHGLFMGLLGNAGLNAPLYVYVSRWFDRRRGSALALISSGGYLAGFVWPTLFERAIANSAGAGP